MAEAYRRSWMNEIPRERGVKMGHDECIDQANSQLPLGYVNMRIYWHPYTNDDRAGWVDVTGMDVVEVMHLCRIEANLLEALRFHRALRRGIPYHDPRMGCIVREAE